MQDRRTGMAVAAFTPEQVAKLTEVSVRKLIYWARTGFFVPEIASSSRSMLYVYSFRDVVSIRTIAMLRSEVSLQELRKVGEVLREESDRPWSALRFYLKGKKIYFKAPADQAPVSADGRRQRIAHYAVAEIAADVERRVIRANRRTSAEVGQIAKARGVMSGAPVLAGTRIPTAAVWEFHEAGFTPKQIVEMYPRLRKSDVAAALRFEKERRKTKRAA